MTTLSLWLTRAVHWTPGNMIHISTLYHSDATASDVRTQYLARIHPTIDVAQPEGAYHLALQETDMFTSILIIPGLFPSNRDWLTPTPVQPNDAPRAKPSHVQITASSAQIPGLRATSVPPVASPSP